MIYAVIDTNVLVATLFPRYQDSATARVVRAVFEGRIIPVKSNEILEEYRKVLMRPYVHFPVGTMEPILAVIESHGVELSPRSVDFDFPDESDRVFFEVAFSGESLGTRLVTGNQKHYPISPIVVTPAEMVKMLDGER